eukprot:2853006-Rhodomonas_salina.1
MSFRFLWRGERGEEGEGRGNSVRGREKVHGKGDDDDEEEGGRKGQRGGRNLGRRWLGVGKRAAGERERKRESEEKERERERGEES